MAESLEDFLIAIGFEVEGDQATTESDKILQRFRSQSAKAADFVAAQFKRAAGLAAGAIGAIAASGVAALHHYVELGSEVGSLSEKLGVGTRELQRLQAGVTATGGSTDALKDALKTLTVGLQEAKTKGSGPLFEGLQLVGVQLSELEGLNAEQQFGVLADALNEIKDPADRTATSLRLFGEAGGLELGGLLSRGSEGIRELGDEAERLGLVLDEDAVAGAKRLKASLGQLEAVGATVVARVGEQLAPKLQELATGALEWVEANDQFIQQDLPAAIEGTISSIGSLVTWLIDVQREFRAFGRDVELAYIEVTDFGKGIADAATAIADELEPAISAVLFPLKVAADVFLGIQETVAGVVAEILDLVGVLDDVKAAVDRLPVVGSGGVREGFDNEAGTVARGAASFLGADSQAKADASAERRRAAAAEAATPGALAIGRTAAAAAEALVAEGRARAAASARRADQRAAGRRALAAGSGGGGGGGGSSSKSASSGKGGILDKLGLGGLFEEHAGEGLAGLLGFGSVDHAPAGGGSSPLAGATFVTQEVNTTATVTIELPQTALAGLTPGAQADVIAAAVRDALGEQNRRALDYVQTPVRR